MLIISFIMDVNETSTNQLRAYLRLHLADGLGSVRFGKLLDAFGDVASAATASETQLKKVDGIGAKTAAAIAAVTDERIDTELTEIDRCGVSLLTLGDPAYPAALKNIYDPPPVLYVRGQLCDTDSVAMAVVGSRRCTHYGLEQAERFGQLLGRAGFTVVSGGARGIDTAAHRGCLAAGGRTIAVMGCGLGKIYPPENEKLFDKIVADGRGALVSELPMTAEIRGANFPKRNRIISGLSLGALIVEAARRSGSLITARTADEQGRVVFAIPGRVDSPLSQGTNELIRDGVILTQNLEDILEHLGPVGEMMTPADEPAAPVTPADLPPDEAKLLETLTAESLSLDDLVRRTGIDSGPAASAMTMLVIKGLVAQKPGNIFARNSL